MSEQLTRGERMMYEYMLHHANTDVAIDDICAALAIKHLTDARRAQQYVGAVISRINKKQNQYEIIPGLQVKRTYRLQTKTLLV